jgi:hypothetical protein
VLAALGGLLRREIIQNYSQNFSILFFIVIDALLTILFNFDFNSV